MKKKIKAAFIIKDTGDPAEIVQAVALPVQGGKWSPYPALKDGKGSGFYRRLFNLSVKTYLALYDLKTTGKWPQGLTGKKGELLISGVDEPGYHALAGYIRQTNEEQPAQKKNPRFMTVPSELKKFMFEHFAAYGKEQKHIRLKVPPENIEFEFWALNKFEEKIGARVSTLGPNRPISLTKSDRKEIAFSDDPRVLGKLAERVHKYDCLKNPRWTWVERYRQALYDEEAFRYFIEIRGEHDTASKGPEIEENDGPLTLAEMIAKYHRLIFVGPSGSGKTTTLKHYAYLVGQEERFKERNRPIGIYVNLADFDLAIEITNSLRLSTEQALELFLVFVADSICATIDSASLGKDVVPSNRKNTHAGNRLQLPPRTKLADRILKWLKSESDNPDVIFFFDAFDNISSRGRAICTSALQQFSERKNPFVVASHRLGIEDLYGDVCRFNVIPLSKLQMFEYIDYRLGITVRRRIQSELDSPDSYLRKLASNPYYLSRIVNLLIEDPDTELPQTAGKLQRKIIDKLFVKICYDMRSMALRDQWPVLMQFLKNLATWFEENNKRNFFIYPRDLSELKCQSHPDKLLLELADRYGILSCESFGLLASPESPKVRFSHELLKDYFAACDVKDKIEGGAFDEATAVLCEDVNAWRKDNVLLLLCTIIEREHSARLIERVIALVPQQRPELAFLCLAGAEISCDEYRLLVDNLVEVFRKALREESGYCHRPKDIFEIAIKAHRNYGLELAIDFACFIEGGSETTAKVADEVLWSLDIALIQQKILSYIDNAIEHGEYLDQLEFLLKYVQLADAAAIKTLSRLRTHLKSGYIKIKNRKNLSNTEVCLRDTLYRLGDSVAKKELQDRWEFPKGCRIIDILKSKPLGFGTIPALILCCQKSQKAKHCNFCAKCVITYFEKRQGPKTDTEERMTYQYPPKNWLVEVERWADRHLSHCESGARKLLGSAGLCENTNAVACILRVAAGKEIIDQELYDYLAYMANKFESSRRLIVESLDGEGEVSFKQKLVWILAHIGYAPYEYVRKVLKEGTDQELFATLRFLYQFPEPGRIRVEEVFEVLKKQKDKKVLVEGARALRSTLRMAGYLYEQIHPFVVENVKDADIEYEAELLILLKWRDFDLTCKSVNKNHNGYEKKLLMKLLKFLADTHVPGEYFETRHKFYHKELVRRIISKWRKIPRLDMISAEEFVKREYRRTGTEISDDELKLLAHELYTCIMSEYWLNRSTSDLLKLCLPRYKHEESLLKYKALGYRSLLDDNEIIEADK